MPIAKFWPSSGRPSEPVVRAAALTPTTRPSRSTSGPPELPGFSAVSVWTASRIGRHVGGGIAERARGAETTPRVEVTVSFGAALAG